MLLLVMAMAMAKWRMSFGAGQNATPGNDWPPRLSESHSRAQSTFYLAYSIVPVTASVHSFMTQRYSAAHNNLFMLGFNRIQHSG